MACSHDQSNQSAENGTLSSPEMTFSFYLNIVGLGLIVFGLVGNALTIVIFTTPRMRSPINSILAGLAFIDSVVLLLSVLLFIVPAMNVYYQRDILHKVWTLAVLGVYPIVMTARSSSVWVFVIITFERFLAVCYPLKQRKMTSKRRASSAVAITVLCSFCYNIIRYWEYVAVYDCTGELMTIDFGIRLNTVYYWVYYTSLYLVTHFVVPFCLILVFNCYIIVTIRKVKLQRQTLTRQQLKEHKTTYMMVAIIFIFIATNTLPYIQNIVEATDMTKLDPIITDVSNLLVIFNSATNCVIYFLFSEKYRSYCKLYMSGRIKSTWSMKEANGYTYTEYGHNASRSSRRHPQDIARHNSSSIQHKKSNETSVPEMKGNSSLQITLASCSTSDRSSHHFPSPNFSPNEGKEEDSNLLSVTFV